jgi:hypothetical protein
MREGEHAFRQAYHARTRAFSFSTPSATNALVAAPLLIAVLPSVLSERFSLPLLPPDSSSPSPSSSPSSSPPPSSSSAPFPFPPIVFHFPPSFTLRRIHQF